MKNDLKMKKGLTSRKQLKLKNFLELKAAFNVVTKKSSTKLTYCFFPIIVAKGRLTIFFFSLTSTLLFLLHVNQPQASQLCMFPLVYFLS